MIGESGLVTRQNLRKSETENKHSRLKKFVGKTGERKAGS